ncbi:MAG: hypothetical protein V2B19_24020 [Pseudomonadota bacterium]
MKPGLSVIIISFELLIISSIIMIAKHWSSVPYNVRELFDGSSALLSISFFWLLLNLLLGFPVWLARFHMGRGLKKYLLFPFTIWGMGIIAWFLLRITVPVESLYDLIGTPVLGWRWEFECIYRFMFLYSAPLVIFSFGAFTVLYYRYFPHQRIDFISIGGWVMVGAVQLFLCHVVVVMYAATDNLTELMAYGGGVVSSVMLFLWLLTLGLFGSAVSCSAAQGKIFVGRILLVLIVSCLLGYGLLLLGLENRVEKYGKIFSAMQFLLSPNRESLVSEGGVFLRYSLVHITLFMVTGVIQIPFWQLIKK